MINITKLNQAIQTIINNKDKYKSDNLVIYWCNGYEKIMIIDEGKTYPKGLEISIENLGKEWTKIEDKFLLKDEFMSQSHPKTNGLYVDLKVDDNSFALVFLNCLDPLEKICGHQTQFTNKDIERLNIPIEKYKKIKINNIT